MCGGGSVEVTEKVKIMSLCVHSPPPTMRYAADHCLHCCVILLDKSLFMSLVSCQPLSFSFFLPFCHWKWGKDVQGMHD